MFFTHIWNESPYSDTTDLRLGCKKKNFEEIKPDWGNNGPC